MPDEAHGADRKLAARARCGDRVALAALYERHKRCLLGFLYRAVGERALAEDVFQEVWIKVLQVIESFDPDRAPFRAWLFRIASNTAVDRLRHETVRRGASLDEPAVEGSGTRVDNLVSPEPGPDQWQAAGETGRALARSLASLPGPQRNAVLLRHQQGLSDAELSEALGVSEGAARALVHRGSATLRRALGEQRHD